MQPVAGITALVEEIEGAGTERVRGAGGLAAAGLARFAREVADRSAAQHAADAVALAGAVDGRESAAAIAERNDAELADFAQEGDVVTVEIKRRGVRARARAELVAELASERESAPLPVRDG